MSKELKANFCLDPSYATTRHVTRQQPFFEDQYSPTIKNMLLPSKFGRIGEGGLRTKGYFKKSLPNRPLITIITVVFNAEQHLENTILSVINQAYDNIEYLIIDGCSTDGTLNIIRKYESLIDYWVSEKDSGIYDAMNKGIEVASGKWLNFMNAGDILLIDFNEIQHELLSDYSIIYGNCNVITIENEILYTSRCVVNNIDILFKKMPMCHQAVLYNERSILKYNLSYKIIADRIQIFEIIVNNGLNKIKYIDYVFANYLEGGISNSQFIQIINEEREFLKVNNKWSAIYSFRNFYLVNIKKPIYDLLLNSNIFKLYRYVKYFNK